MADDFQEKTEAPSTRRLEEARSRGQIGKSTDLTGALILLAVLVMLHFTGQDILARLMQVTRECLGGAGGQLEEEATAVLTLNRVCRETAIILLPVMLIVSVVALVCVFLQVGVVFTVETIKPTISRLNPINGLKRMFDTHALVMLAMGVGKSLILGLIAYFTIRGKMDLLTQLTNVHYMGIVAVIADLVFSMGLRMAIALLILAILDLIYQKRRIYNQLKMTKMEVREELKRMDGDPQVKRRRRDIQMQLSLQRIRSAVPKADVVITNPTEFAVAIQYDAKTMAAPRVVAKGVDHMAVRIRRVAIENGVPIVERPPLARALYREVEVGREVPPTFYKAVAEILAYVYELAGRGHSPRAAMSLN